MVKIYSILLMWFYFSDGFTPLHYAARWGREAEVTKLLEVGVDVEQRNDQGLTPLMMAAIGEHNQCLQILTNFGAKVNILFSFLFFSLSVHIYLTILYIFKTTTRKRRSCWLCSVDLPNVFSFF
jgi:ankyrin repeat protein